MSNVARTALTEAKIRSLGPGEHSDGRVPGLTLEITAAGHAGWRLRYVAPGGARRNVKVGTHSASPEARRTPVVGVDEARRLASALRVQVAKGMDPALDRDRARRASAPTVKDACTAYLADHVERRCTAGTLRLTRDLIHRRILPTLGRIELAQLTRPQIVAWHAAIGAPKPTGQGFASEANRTLTVLAAALEHAAHAELVDPTWRNPCVRIRRFDERTRVREVLSPVELAAVAVELREGPRRKPQSPGWISQHVADAISICAETGMRPGEVCSLRWANVDLDARTLNLAGTKTGYSERPFSESAAELFRAIAIRRYGRNVPPESALVCATSTGTAIARQNLTGAWARIRKRLKITARLYATRHTVATTLLEHGARTEDAARALGHSNLSTTARYLHDSTDRAREALDRVGGLLSGAPTLRVVTGGRGRAK